MISTTVWCGLSGTMAGIQSLISNPGDHFSSLHDVFAGLSAFNIRIPTQSQQHTFKANIHDRYINKVIEHLNPHFPDATILEAFSVFDLWASEKTRHVSLCSYNIMHS